MGGEVIGKGIVEYGLIRLGKTEIKPIGHMVYDGDMVLGTAKSSFSSCYGSILDGIPFQKLKLSQGIMQSMTVSLYWICAKNLPKGFPTPELRSKDSGSTAGGAAPKNAILANKLALAFI